MSLLGGGFPVGPWFQNTTALGIFGILAPRYDWIPAWFPSPDPPAKETFSSSSWDFDQLALALDRLIEESLSSASDDEDLVAQEVDSLIKALPARDCAIAEKSSSS